MVDFKKIAELVDEESVSENFEHQKIEEPLIPSKAVYAPPLTGGSHNDQGEILSKKLDNKNENSDSEVSKDSSQEQDKEGEKEKALEPPKIPEVPPKEEAPPPLPPPPLDGPYQYQNSDHNMVTATYEAGVLNGPYTVVTPEDKPVIEATMKEGQLEGICKIYEGDLLKSETEFLRGKIHGIAKQYDENGNVILETTFQEGEKVGPMQSFHPDGSPAVVSTFDQDQLNGPSQSYNEQNQLIMKTEYKDGKIDGTMENFYSGLNGDQLMRSAEYKDGKLDGEEKVFYTTGEPLSVGEYEAGKLKAPAQTFKKKTK